MPSLRFQCLLLACLLPAVAMAAGKRKARIPSARGKPNVLFIVVSNLRGDVANDPEGRFMPNLHRLAQQSLSFTQAHANATLSNPSRTSLLTGLLPASSGIYHNEQDWRRSAKLQDVPTLPEYFRSKGYLTVAAGPVFHASPGGPNGRLNGWLGGRRGFEQDAAWERRFPEPGVQVPDLPVRMGQNDNGLGLWQWDWAGLNVPDELTEDGAVAAWAGNFLSQRQPEPFFLAVGFSRPGLPWYVPQSYVDGVPADAKWLTVNDGTRQAFGQSEEKDVLSERLADGGRIREARRAYLAAVAFVDTQIGRVLAALEAGPHAQDTLIVLTSDHGQPLGEGQCWQAGGLQWEASHVPLLMAARGLTQPDARSDRPVALVDLYPTLCDLVKLPAPAHLDGMSLLPLLKDPEARRERPVVTSTGAGTAYAVRDARWSYFRHQDGREALYDHRDDVQERNNLAASTEHAEDKRRLVRALPKIFESATRPAEVMVAPSSPDGSEHWLFQAGDRLEAGQSPKVAGRGLLIDTVFDYQPAVDADSTLLVQGGTTLGYALHLRGGRPTLTLWRDGQSTEIAVDPLPAGVNHVRAMMDGAGSLSLFVPRRGEIMAKAPFEGGFPGQPQERGISVGVSDGVLPLKDYPDRSPFDGEIRRMRLTVLPAASD